MLKKRFGDWKVGIEEIILFLIIILNVFDAIEHLPSTLDYIKKIISWAALGFIFYRAKPTKIIFGTYQKGIEDIMLISGYFLILIKDLVSYAMSSVNDASSFLVPFFNALIKNQSSIEIFGIYAGMLLILAVSINMILKHPIRGPSVMHIIHEDGPIPNNFKDFFHRLLTSFAVLVAFYLIVFNLVMEWLAIAIDAPLLMIALGTYIFFIIKHREKFNSRSFLSKFGDFGSSFYEDVIKHFTYKKTILRALFAMLVLHIATESLHFIWPYVFGVADSLYFGLLSSPHLSMFQVFALDSIATDFLGNALLFVTIAGNIIAILFLLLAPGYLWYLIYKNKKFTLSKMQIGILISSLLMFILSPAFKIRPLTNEALIGVNISGHSIVQNSIIGIPATVLIALSVGLICALLSTDISKEKKIMRLITIVTQIFFTIYIALFTYSISNYYIQSIIYLSTIKKYVLLIIFALFFIITVLFYLFGTIGFIKDTSAHAKEHLTAK
ncbi:hypothetical protein JXA48_01455 [Candidatus Woesearchaeota archaeon]|nr:hypothetical protein [Candidatus Woesearchaeota archaeon]